MVDVDDIVDTNDPDWLVEVVAASRLQKSGRWVRKLAEDGKLTTARNSDGKTVYSRADVDALVSEVDEPPTLDSGKVVGSGQMLTQVSYLLRQTQGHAKDMSAQARSALGSALEPFKWLIEAQKAEITALREECKSLRCRLNEQADREEALRTEQWARDTAMVQETSSQQRKDFLLQTAIQQFKVIMSNNKVAQVIRQLTEDDLELIALAKGNENAQQLREVRDVLNKAEEDEKRKHQHSEATVDGGEQATGAVYTQDRGSVQQAAELGGQGT